MKKVYTEEMKKYIIENCQGKTARQFHKEFNNKFGTDITYTAIKSYFTAHKIRIGRHNNRKYNEDHIRFLKENVKGITLKELTNRFNKRFNMNVNESAIANLKVKYKLSSGIVGGQFSKGHQPANKGKRGSMSPEQYKKCKATMFKKGNIPKNHRPIGSERIDVEGYTHVKVAEPNKWKPKHRVLWEEKNGPIPEKHKVIFADGNKQNICLENLILVSNAEQFIMNQNNLYKNDAELTKTGIVVAKLLNTVNKRKKG